MASFIISFSPALQMYFSWFIGRSLCWSNCIFYVFESLYPLGYSLLVDHLYAISLSYNGIAINNPFNTPKQVMISYAYAFSKNVCQSISISYLQSRPSFSRFHCLRGKTIANGQCITIDSFPFNCEFRSSNNRSW